MVAQLSQCRVVCLLPVLLLAVTACGASHSSTKSPSLGYAALGASETYGVGASPRTSAYPFLVARQLRASRFADLGISGATLADAYRAEVKGALAIHPRLCTTFFGLNDLRNGVSQDGFDAQLARLVKALQRAACRVLIIGLPDVSLLPAVRQTGIPFVSEIVSEWNRGMRQVAGQTGAAFLDLSGFDAELARHPEYVSSDGLHPSDAGHARIASVVVSKVRAGGLWPAG